MVNFLYSYYRPILLVLLVLLGVTCGHLIDSLLQIKLRPAASSEQLDRPVAARPSRGLDEAALNAILRNNIFDADNRSATATMTLSTTTAAQDQSAVAPPRTDLTLIGTVVAGEDSLALLEIGREMQVYRLDQEVEGGGRIESIARTAVTIRNRDQSLATLYLDEEAASGTAAPPSRPARSAGTAATDAGGIREVGDNRWVVSQNLVDTVRSNFSTQLRLAQMQPRLVAGVTDGFLVQRLYPQSILAKMGLQRGDVVVDVNDIRLDSPEKALQVFQQLRDARRLTVAVERNGQPMSFVYEIE
jgi:general secretion pathway protein C